jgi:hypothetical protein
MSMAKKFFMLLLPILNKLERLHQMVWMSRYFLTISIKPKAISSAGGLMLTDLLIAKESRQP